MSKIAAALFPLTFLSATHSISALVVTTGLLGLPEIAAEIVIVQGAIIAAFHAFSGNARNLILRENGGEAARRIAGARVLLLPALLLAAFGLGVFNAAAGVLLAALLVVRRAAEWLAEVYLCVLEIRGARRASAIFLGTQIALFLAVAASLVGGFRLWPWVLGAWALSPLLQSAAFLARTVPAGIRGIRSFLPELAPHFGSTLVIGFALYVFRLVILSVTDKATTGILFTAIAIGSFLATIYANVLGPSLALRGSALRFSLLPRWAKVTLAIVALCGIATATTGLLGLVGDTDAQFFARAMGFSLVGGVIMLSAQQIRLRLLIEGEGQDAFGADVLAHVLLVLVVATAPIIGGSILVSAAYLANGALCWVAYRSAELGRRRLADRKRDRWLLPVLTLSLFLPIFLLLDGHIYTSVEPLLDSGGSILNLPLPLALFAVFPGIFLLAKYRDAGPALAWIAIFFLTIVLASIAAAGAGATLPRAKLLLLIQCLLPTFGLALGAMFAAHHKADKYLSSGLLWVLLLIVPVQLMQSWVQHSLSLLHHVAFFDVYQHLQYVPTVLACAFLVVLGARWGSGLNRALVGAIGIGCAIYAAASYSLLAIVFLVCGVFIIALREVRVRHAWALAGFGAAVLGTTAIYVHATSETEIYLDKYGGRPERTELACVAGAVARASVLVRETDHICVVEGEPRALSAPILRVRSITVTGAETFRVKGDLRKGRIVVGLTQNGSWLARRIVDTPGPFTAEFRPAPGTYQGVIFNDNNRARYIDLSIDRTEWLRPDGKSLDVPRPGTPVQRPVDVVVRGEAKPGVKTTWAWENLPTNWRERFDDWFMYARRVVAEPRVALIGAAAPLDRSVRTSAHNYFIDFLYNFGVVGLSPIFALIAYTLLQILRNRRWIWSSRPLFALCIAVVFAALVDSLFKVTLRQPYSGLTAFFLWGMLLYSLRRPELPERITEKG